MAERIGCDDVAGADDEVPVVVVAVGDVEWLVVVWWW